MRVHRNNNLCVFLKMGKIIFSLVVLACVFVLSSLAFSVYSGNDKGDMPGSSTPNMILPLPKNHGGDIPYP